MPDTSRVCNLHCSSQQCQILNPLGEARDRTCILRILIRFFTLWATMGSSKFIPFFFCFGVISKKPLPNPRSWRFIPMFSFGSFIVLVIAFTHAVQLEWIFVHGVTRQSSPILLCVIVSAALVERIILSPLNSLGKNQVRTHKSIRFLTLNPTVSTCISILVDITLFW